MDTLIIALIIVAAAATVFVLVRGIATMAQGRDVTGVQSNRLMGLRVLFQAVTILLVIVLLLLSRGHGA
jgi:heme/copper-type cytochrome/quinol oxidase subunit 2